MNIIITISHNDLVSQFLTPPEPAYEEYNEYNFYINDDLTIRLYSYTKYRKEGNQRKFREIKKWERHLNVRNNSITREEIISELTNKNEFLYLKNKLLEELNKKIIYEF